MSQIIDFFKKNKKVLLAGLALDVLVLFAFSTLVGVYVYVNRTAIRDRLIPKFASPAVRPSEPRQQEGKQNPPVSAKGPTIVDIVEKVNPAVVSIVITKDVPVLERHYEKFSPFNDFFGNNPFAPFDFRIPQYREKGTEKKEVGGGSGFFASPDGLVVTNKHVVADTNASYTVLTNDGRKFEAQVLAKDPFLDIAVLKVKGGGFPHLSFGDSDSLKLGQTVIAIGNALGEFRNSVSVGVISGLSRSIVAGDNFGRSEVLEEVIQTDAAINPGNSGGPLLDLQGNVIGINVAIAQGSENIGFALPANTVKGAVESVKKHGEIVRPFLGVRYTQINEELKRRNHLPVDYGALVIRGKTPEDIAVIPGSPADKAGIVENDIILEADGQKLTQGHSLAALIHHKNVGDTVTLKILHNGKEKEAAVVLEKAPED